MGQYQKHLYGSTLYGKMNVFYGQYETEVFDAQEKFTGKINHTISAILPYATYKPDEYETTLSGIWDINSSHQAVTDTSTSTFQFKASGRSFEVFYVTQQHGTQTLHLTLTKEDGTVLYSQDVNTYSLSAPSVKSYKFPLVPFDSFNSYIVNGSLTAGASYGFTLDSFKIVSADIGVEIRGSADKSTWTTYESVTSTYTQTGTTDSWTITGTTTNTYTTVRYIQARLTLVTSEQTSAPTVQRIVCQSGSSNLRTKNGIWYGIFDMAKVAAAESTRVGHTVTFKQTNAIRWDENVPDGTSLTIRSSSSYENQLYGPVSAPYKKNVKRLRLKDGITEHSVLIGPITPVPDNPDPTDPKRFWTVKGWTEWNDLSYMPKDASDITVNYIFSSTSTDVENGANLLQNVLNPMTYAQDGTANKLTFKPQDFYVTIKMQIPEGKATPVVDLLNLYCDIDYSEPVAVEDKVITALDNNGTGRLKLQNISNTTFTPPPTTNESAYNVTAITDAGLTYNLTDKTNRPTDVKVFYLSKEMDTKDPLNTTSVSEQIYAKVFVASLPGQPGVLKSYQYNGGGVQYLVSRQEEMPSDFTPILDKNKQYKYHLTNGWPDESHIVQLGETLQDIADMHATTVADIQAEMKSKKLTIQYDSKGNLVVGKKIFLPNISVNPNVTQTFSDGTTYTTKSAHNARLLGLADTSSDIITIQIPTLVSTQATGYGYTDWISEEKIYDGFINFDDIRGAYIRTQYNTTNASSFERTWKVLKAQTYSSIAKQFDVDVNDLMARNNNEPLVVGMTIIIPPNIILPYIAQGVELDDNPYIIEIVDNSVHKKDGTPLDKMVIPIIWKTVTDGTKTKTIPLDIHYRTSNPVTVNIVRGDVANDLDALKHHGVVAITQVTNKTTNMDYIPNQDYKLNGDYIDWTPATDLSREPAKNETYSVTYTYQEVDYVVVQLDTTYVEETGVDLVWRSPETKVLDGICSPGNDSMVQLPAMNTFTGYGELTVKDYDYVVEDNDLWVETSVVQYNGKPYVLGSLKNRNPKENWFPLITPGFYYLKEDEYYLYSEILETPLEEKEIPIAKNVMYVPTDKDMGIRLEPKRTNFVTNSTFNTKDWKTAGTFNFKTV
jgi:hypothetical protein